MNYTHEDYTVALICASPADWVASKLMLDEEHPSLPADFQCRYTLGRIGPHNVAIAFLTGGTTSPWEVDYLLYHFRNIRFGLMVGIGGGAPATPSDDPNKDIRLGDVVVSHSEGNHGGVLRYNTGEIPQRCFFYKPPAILTTAVSELRSRNEAVRNAISQHISNMVKSRPTMMEVFQYPGHEHDQLFEANYEHKWGGIGCKMCDKERLVHRKLRDTEHPVIHYGVIGSVREDMRHSATREKLRQEHGILCFETVADGLMLNFPCLFIRGICDYFNTHKNEDWKEYAAVTAAAYAKELLQTIPANQVVRAKKALRIMEQTSAEVGSINKDLERLLNEQRRKERDDILDLIMSSPTYEDQHKDILKQRHPGTGQWFLESPEFTKWLRGVCRNLYCSGTPGTGKTVLASVAIEHIRAQSGMGRPVAFIYCNSQMKKERTVQKLLRMVLHQFLSQCASIPVSVKGVLESSMRLERQPRSRAIIKAIHEAIEEQGGAYLVLDGLDQCSSLVRKGLLTLARDLQQDTYTSLMVTSCPIHSIERRFARVTRLGIPADSRDMECYLDGHLSTLALYYQDNAVLWKKLKASIIKRAKGSFLEANDFLETLKV
ncbi:hypothetical protein MBR_06628, partial [Metarhizium brunneum ARSEF 3297]